MPGTAENGSVIKLGIADQEGSGQEASHAVAEENIGDVVIFFPDMIPQALHILDDVIPAVLFRKNTLLIQTGSGLAVAKVVVADGNIAMFNLQEGQRVRVTLSIDAHEYQDRWYNNFRAVNVANPDAAPEAVAGVPPIGVPLPPPAEPQAPTNDQALPWEG